MVLSKKQKKQVVKELSEHLKTCPSVVFVNFNELDVASLRDLRNRMREHSATLKVYKNTLLARALKQAMGASASLAPDILNKPILVAFAGKDEIAPFKTLNEFAKNTDAIQLKAGIFERQLISELQVKEIANLPSKQELRGQLVGLLASLPARLTRALNFPIFAFASVLEQHQTNQTK